MATQGRVLLPRRQGAADAHRVFLSHRCRPGAMFPCKSFSRIGLAPSAHPDFSARSSPLFQDATRFNDFETCERPSRLGRCRRGPNSLNGCARHGLRSVLAVRGLGPRLDEYPIAIRHEAHATRDQATLAGGCRVCACEPGAWCASYQAKRRLPWGRRCATAFA